MRVTGSTRLLTHVDAYGTATITLNRPDVHNAFDPETVQALTATLIQFRKEVAIRSVVISGAGPSFCAGADITHMRKSARYSAKKNHAMARATARMFHTLYTLNKPTLAIAHGAVRGGGCGIVAACDIAIAARTATFRLSEVKIGIIPAMISPYVISAMGERQARRYMLTGEMFDAAEAWRIGLVHDIVEQEDLAARAGDLLGDLYSSGPRAMQAIKQLIPRSARSAIGPGIVEATARQIAEIRATTEAQEGLLAFLEKRRPAWSQLPASRRRKQP